MPCARKRDSYTLLQKIKEAIDDYAEREMETASISGGDRTGAGCKHT